MVIMVVMIKKMVRRRTRKCTVIDRILLVRMCYCGCGRRGGGGGVAYSSR